MDAKRRKQQSGWASVEAAALLIIFGVMLGYTFGAFGIVHTGIVNSIAARTYAFETFDNRSDLRYFRSNRFDANGDTSEHYQNIGFRVHGILSGIDADNPGDPEFIPTERWLTLKQEEDVEEGRNERNHARLEQDPPSGQERLQANPVWIKTTYGICIDFACGGVQ